jgi:hypothetical protein
VPGRSTESLGLFVTKIASLVAVLLISSAHAEIEKLATPTPNGMSFAWWPKVAIPPGWKHEREQSLAYGINALSPAGASFANAQSVMYAKAVYKPREPLVKSLDDLITKDKKEFLAENPKLTIREGDPIKSKDGKPFRVFSFIPRSEGNWERVAYGEEGEFYLVFVLSSRVEKGYNNSRQDFERLIREYKEKP